MEVNSTALRRFGKSVSDVVSMFREAGWTTTEIANPYSADFYFRPLHRALVKGPRDDVEQVDLMFARPACCGQLHVADGASDH